MLRRSGVKIDDEVGQKSNKIELTFISTFYLKLANAKFGQFLKNIYFLTLIF